MHEEIEVTLPLRGIAATIHSRILVFSFAVQKQKLKMCRSVISTIVLGGCGTLFLTLSGGHRLKFSKDRVLRKMSGPCRK
jgi:hypothetical protein